MISCYIIWAASSCKERNNWQNSPSVKLIGCYEVKQKKKVNFVKKFKNQINIVWKK